jgi:hypothetical protein
MSGKQCPHCGGTGAEPSLPGVFYRPAPEELHALCSSCCGQGSREWLELDHVRNAAPELLEALRYIAKTWPDSFAARHARAAIAKATRS